MEKVFLSALDARSGAPLKGFGDGGTELFAPWKWQSGHSLAVDSHSVFAASGFKTVNPALHDVRMSKCQTCEHRRDSQCAICRCFIDKKAWLPHEDCPIGRWPG